MALILRFLVVALIISILIDKTESIIGGTNASEDHFKYQALINGSLFGNSFPEAGAAIPRIKDSHGEYRYIITSGRVLTHRELNSFKREYNLLLGVHNVRNHNKLHKNDIDKLFIDGDFDGIGLVRLQHPIQLSGDVEAINLSTDDVAIGTVCTASGFGAVHYAEDIHSSFYRSDILKYINVTIVGMDECRKFYENRIAENYIYEEEKDLIKKLNDETLSNRFLCTKSPEREQLYLGDVGNPLVCHDKKLIGTLYKPYTKYAVFVKVSAYIGWIRNTIANN